MLISSNNATRLAGIRARLRNAGLRNLRRSPTNPGTVFGPGPKEVYFFGNRALALFFACVPTDLTYLIDRVEQLERQCRVYELALQEAYTPDARRNVQ